jgi:hypothetical protein
VTQIELPVVESSLYDFFFVFRLGQKSSFNSFISARV